MRIDYPAPEQEGQLRELWQLAFGDSEASIGSFFATGYTRSSCRCVTIDGQAAAALYWFDAQYDGQKFAYLYAVATHPSYRHQGLCRELMEDTHALLTGLGYDGALLMPAAQPLRRMYAGLGYQECCTVSEFRCEAGAAVPIQRVDAREYAQLRRGFLPQGGVIQEGRNLTYLEAYAALYAGENFLLAAAPDGAELQGIELLGDQTAAPGLLGALGYAQGSFRTPGGDIPFAMFCPLKAGAKAPKYFGLAFD